MDKNPDGGLGGDFLRPVNSVLCHDAFVKERIIQKIIDKSPASAILLDFDRLYTGYVNSGMAAAGSNLHVYSPTKEDWKDVFAGIVSRTCARRAVLIVDSLNGFFGMFDERDAEEESVFDESNAGRYANACMMVLARCMMNAGGWIFLCSVARIGEGGDWILQPTGRRVPDSESMSRFFVKGQDGLQVEMLSRENKAERIFRL